MPNPFEIEEMVKQNPLVDPEKLREALEAVRQLKLLGVKEAEFDILPPFSRRPVAGDDRKATRK